MSSSSILKETNLSPNQTKTFEPIFEKGSPLHKNIFAIKSENQNKPKDKRFHKIKKENSVSLIHQPEIKPITPKIENLLDFDKILDLLYGNKDKKAIPVSVQAEHKSRKKTFLHRKKNRSKGTTSITQSK